MLNKLLLQRPLFLGVLIKRNIPPSFQLAISFIVLLLTPVVFADLNEFPSLPSETPPLKTLEEMLATPGIYNFRVIVELNTDAVNPSSSTRAGDRSASLEEQAAEVAAVQDLFFDSLTTGMITPAGNMNPTKFEFVKAVAMTVDRFTLSQIKQNSLVTKVVLDQAVPLALTESIPLIG